MKVKPGELAWISGPDEICVKLSMEEAHWLLQDLASGHFYNRYKFNKLKKKLKKVVE